MRDRDEKRVTSAELTSEAAAAHEPAPCPTPPIPPWRAAAWLAAYIGAVAWLTWPLAESALTAVRGNVITHLDAIYSLWAMAWTSHTLVTAPLQLPNANIYHPTPHAFFYGPGALGGVPLFAPVFWVTGNPVLACNVVFIGGVALTGWTTHLVVRRWTASDLAGIVAAATILTNGWFVYGFVQATPHMAMLQYLPLIAYGAARPARRLREMMPLLALVVAQSVTECVYVAPAVFALLGVLALLRLARAPSRAAGLRLLVVLALAALALAPLYAGYFVVRRENPNLDQQSVYPTHPFFYVLPRQLLTHGSGPAVFLPATITLVGLGLIALACRRWAPGRAPARAGWAHGALWTIVGIVISLSPVTLSAYGRVPLPQALIPDLYTHLRVPARLGTVGLVGAAVLAGMAFCELARWIDIRGRRRPIAALARLALATAAIVPLHVGYGELQAHMTRSYAYPLTPPAERLVAEIRREPGPLVEVPPDLHGIAMYNSVFHRSPLLNGYSSYFPADFPARMALARELPAADALAALRARTGVAMVLVHISQLPRPQRTEWLRLAGDGRPDIFLAARTSNDLLFRVRTVDASSGVVRGATVPSTPHPARGFAGLESFTQPFRSFSP
jgi:hypothetical protein